MTEKSDADQFSFTDCEGITWRLRLTLDHLETINDTLGVNLGTLEGQIKAAETLFGDYLKLKAFLWILCEQQADAKQISPSDFGGRIDADVIGQLLPEVEQLLANFTRPDHRSIVSTAREKSRELFGAGVQQLEELASGEIKQEFLQQQREVTLQKTREGIRSAFGDS